MAANPFLPFLPLLPPAYAGADWTSSPPILPTPDIQAEMIPATGYTSAVLPDEFVGDWTTATPFAVTPLPEITAPAPVGLQPLP